MTYTIKNIDELTFVDDYMFALASEKIQTFQTEKKILREKLNIKQVVLRYI